MLELLTGQAPRRRRVDPLAHYVPHTPWPRQQAFLGLTCREAFYGGAAAGGKSEALLMAALQYVDTPGYAALILRKDTQRLRLAGGLIPRSHQWLHGRGARWNQANLRWSFPTAGAPATLSFGYLANAQDKFRYGSSEYQFIAFDELTEFAEEDYLFLFSRLRRNREVEAPLRMRAASNPGGPGHAWVKRRFLGESPPRGGGGPAVLWNGDIAFVPARIVDNPAVEEAEYRRSLELLPTVLREQLMEGDWSIQAQGLIRPEWLRYFHEHEHTCDLLAADGTLHLRVRQADMRRLATIDPAGTSRQRAAERRGREPSWSVIQVWDQPAPPHGRNLLLRHQWRERAGFEELCEAIRRVHREWRPTTLYIEADNLGQAAGDVLDGELPLRTISPRGQDKVARAGPLLERLFRGEIYLPRFENSWRPGLEAEWLRWTGLDEECTDQIDAAAYAIHASDPSPAGPLTLGPIAVGGI